MTIVIYYGKKAWDGPTTLKGMMEDIPENLADYVSDYKMNLVEVLHDEDYRFQNEDVIAEFIGKDIAYVEHIVELIFQYPESNDMELAKLL